MAEAEGDVAPEDRAQDAGEEIGPGEPAAVLGGHELGGERGPGEQFLGGGGRLTALVRGEQGAQPVRVGGVVGVAEQGLEPGRAAPGVGLPLTGAGGRGPDGGGGHG